MKAPAEHSLHTFISQMTDEIASEYQRIYARAAEDPGTAGDEGEENWAAVLRDWVPPNYHVRTKGRLIGVDGSASPQIDVVVLKPGYPKKLLEKKLWLADGVAAVFECKNTLVKSHIVDAARRCIEFKKLCRPRSGTPREELRSPLVFGILAHSHSWKSERKVVVDSASDILNEASEVANHPSEQIDLMCVADLANWNSVYCAKYESAWTADPQKMEARLGGRWWITTTFMCLASGTSADDELAKPLGALISTLMSRLAEEDPSLNDFAHYYKRVNLGGSGRGFSRSWPNSIYSDYVKSAFESGRVAMTLNADWEIHGL